MIPVFNDRVFTELAVDFGHAAAMSFLVAFGSLLTSRINRIRQAFAHKDREEILTALLSLQASSAMTGAKELQEMTSRALAVDPVEDQLSEPLVAQLATEAQNFNRTFRSFVEEQRVPPPIIRT